MSLSKQHKHVNKMAWSPKLGTKSNPNLKLSKDFGYYWLQGKFFDDFPCCLLMFWGERVMLCLSEQIIISQYQGCELHPPMGWWDCSKLSNGNLRRRFIPIRGTVCMATLNQYEACKVWTNNYLLVNRKGSWDARATTPTSRERPGSIHTQYRWK